MRSLALVAIATILLALAPGSAAQRDADVTVDVSMVRTWFGPTEPLTFDVTVDAPDSLRDARISVALYERVRSRSSLERTFDGRLPRSPLVAFTVRLPDAQIEGRRTIRVQRPFSELTAFEGAPDGLYPLEVTVRRSTGPALASAVTAVPMLGEPPATPLGLLYSLSLVPPPLLEPNGTATDHTDAGLGRLEENLAGLPVPGAPLTLTAGPLLLEELGSMPAPYEDRAAGLLASIQGVARQHDVATTPRTNAVLAHLDDLPPERGLGESLEAAAEVIGDRLGVIPRPLLHPPGLALDAATLEAVSSLGIDAALVPGSMLLRGELTPTDPVTAEGITLFPVDETISEASTRARSSLAVSRVVARTAMVFFETPGRQRTLGMVTDWDATRAAQLLTALRDAPWVSLVTTDAALATDGRRRRPSFERIGRPPRSFLAALDAAERAVREFESFTLPGNPVADDLSRALAFSRGTAWWADDWDAGRRWARTVVAGVAAERRLISTSGGTVTFTSRRGEVPITIVNRAGYPVRLRIDLSSPKLDFPSGSSRMLESLPPPGRTITFPAIAEATGTFPLEVVITSPDGALEVTSQDLLVRSTAANVLALALTLGAAVFLVAWYGRRLLPSRRTTA